MLGKIKLSDLRMIESLGIYGPRNITDVARKLGIHAETLRKRLKRIHPQIFLYVNIYHTNLGLKKAVVLAQAVPGYEDLLYNCFKVNDFWIYVNRCYGMKEGCLGVYTIPRDNVRYFEDFMYQLEKLGMAQNLKIFWSTCFQSVHSRCNWFDPKDKKWVFQWNKWVGEISSKSTKLPYTLIDPVDFPIKGDETDVFILKEMEKNPAIRFVDLAKMLHISPQLVRYHYKKHILGRGLIESFTVLDFRFDLKVSDMFLFIFNFDTAEKFAKFASSLLDKPFVGGLGKILGENALIAQIYLPRLEFRRFIDTLSTLIRNNLLKNYEYVIQDLRKVERQTISYENFENGTWVYDQNKHIKGLHDLLERRKLKPSMIL